MFIRKVRTRKLIKAALAAVFVSALPMPAAAEYHIATYSQSNGEFGQAVAVIGDLDFNLLDDIVIGDPKFQKNRGKVEIRFSQIPTDPTVQATIAGEGPGDRFGEQIADLGDLTGDGLHEFAVAAPQSEVSGKAGYVKIYSPSYDAESRTLIVNQLRRLSGVDAGDLFGAVVANAGDVDGDSVNDIIIGAPKANRYDGATMTVAQTGSATVFSGASLNVIRVHYGEKSGDGFGQAVAGRGRFNQLAGGAPQQPDPHADYAVGAPTWDFNKSKKDSGRAYIFSGKDGAVVNTLWSESEGNHFGANLAIGNIDFDLYSELAVGIPAASDGKGRVKVFKRDGSVIGVFDGTSGGEHLGRGVYSGVDLTNDGRDEVITYASYGMWEKGRVTVRSYDGDTGKWSAIMQSTGGDKFQWGRSIAFGYLNNQSVRDILLGIPGNQKVKAFDPDQVVGSVTEFGEGTSGADLTVLGDPTSNAALEISIKSGIKYPANALLLISFLAQDTPIYLAETQCNFYLKDLWSNHLPLTFNHDLNLAVDVPAGLGNGTVFMQVIGQAKNGKTFCTPPVKVEKKQ